MRTYCTRIAAVWAATLEADARVPTVCLIMYASANSCVDRLNTEGSRDPASRLTHIADKRRERTTLAETDEQKQERLKKWRREIGADQLCSGCQWEMRTCQLERLAAETN